MKKFLLNKHILLILGLGIVSYILYIRLLMERPSRYFSSINSHTYTFLALIMCIVFSILLLLKIYIFITSKYRQEIAIKGNNYRWLYIREKLIYVFIGIKTIVDKSLFQLNSVFLNMPYSGNIVEYTARFLLKIEYCPVKLLKIVFLIRNLVPIIFVLEIVIFNRLDTFYKVLILLFIPLLVNVIIYNIRYWYRYQMNGMNACVTIEVTDYDHPHITPGAFAVFYCATLDDPVNFNVHYIPNHKAYRKSLGLSTDITYLIETGNILLFLCDVLGYVLYYDNILGKYNKSIYPIIGITLYLLGWIYIFISLYFNILIYEYG